MWSLAIMGGRTSLRFKCIYADPSFFVDSNGGAFDFKY